MIRLRLVICLVLLLFGTFGVAQAANILYFNDWNQGTDAMAGALALSGHTVTTVPTSSQFATEIGGGGYDLGILFRQMTGDGAYADGIIALGNFVAGGGKAIYTDWYMNNTYAAMFGAQWTGDVNDSQVTVTNPELAAGLVNPVQLYNPGWGVFSMDVSGSEIAAIFSDNAGAIAISGLSIVNGFLSDTFVDLGQGQQLYLNEIGYLVGTQAAVPEPCTMLLLGSGLLGVAGLRRRFKR